MSVPIAIALGIVQGLTEFLPVSSSGHLALVQHFSRIDSPGITFEVFVHFGTALAVIVFFRRRIGAIIAAVLRYIRGRAHDRDDARMGFHLLLGTVPAGIVGIISGRTVETAFANPVLVSVFLLLTGVLLWLTRRVSPGARPRGGARDALLIGIAQAIALLPGMSRSGWTLSAGLCLGIRREAAAEFAFLLSVPVILGATVLSLGDAFRSGIPPGAAAIAGTAAAFLSAIPAIFVLLRVVTAGRLYRFAYYCWIAGALGIVLAAVRG